MSNLANVQAGTETAPPAAVTDLAVPIDLTQVSAFTDLKLANPSNVARKAQLRTILTSAIDEEWNTVTPLLTPNGAYAGGAAQAHAIVADRLYQSRESEMESLGDVTLRELWPIIHEMLKKRGLVFDRGFVTKIRR